MKVLITGATGFVGSAVARELFLAGHELLVVSRNAARAESTLGLPVKYLEWDADFKILESQVESLKGTDVIVHLAGESVGEGRWTPRRKAEIRESRVQSAQAIGKLARRFQIKRLIGASAVGIYGDRGEELLTEKSEPGKGFLAEVCQAWEAAAQNGFEGQVTLFRIGVVLGRSVLDGQPAGALAKLIPLFQAGAGGRVGSGRQGMSWIHLTDLVGLFKSAVEDAPRWVGVFNAVGPEPVSNAQFTKTLATALGVHAWLPTPAVALKGALGEMANLLLEGQRVEPARVLSGGYVFKFSNLESALTQIVESEKDGESVFRSGQWLNHPLKDVFGFFSRAENLEAITPPWLNFKILKVSTPEITSGTEIEYQLRFKGVPIHWKTLIEVFEPGVRFVDLQLSGPFKVWHHEHRFYSVKGGTWMEDEVHYRAPGGLLGHLVAGGMVRRDVQKIFNFRRTAVERAEFGANTR